MISVIMIAYNAEAFIEESIKSVINQTHTEWELIIVDDGSIDETKEIINRLGKSEKRIKYIFQNNSKQGIARNTGVLHASGELIAFLDADDLWLPNRLEVSLNEFNNHDCDLLFSDAFISHGDQSIVKHEIRFDVKNANYAGRPALEHFLAYNRIPLLTTLIKKQALEKAGMFSNRGIAEDYEMWLKLLLLDFKFTSISIPLAIYRAHDKSTTSHDRIAVDDCIEMIYALGKNPIYNTEELFSGYLKLWYKRKLDQIEDFKDYLSFIKILKKQNKDNAMLQIASSLFLNAFTFKVHKKIIYYVLK